MKYRQETVNVVLAQVLRDRGLVASPEQVIHHSHGQIRLPDILVDYHGLRLGLECEFESAGGDAFGKAYRKATQRVEEGIAQIGVAVVYPADIQGTPFETLAAALGEARLTFAIVSEIAHPDTQMNLFGVDTIDVPWIHGNVDNLVADIQRSYTELAEESTVDRAVELIESSIGRVVWATDLQPATAQRILSEIGIGDVPTEGGPGSSVGIGPKQRAAISRIASLMIENALIFQEVLSKSDGRIRTLGSFRVSQNAVAELCDHWGYILSEVNYYPIFSIAQRVLACFSVDAAFGQAIEGLIRSALTIVACRAALRHDLAGRIYHRLLEEAKFLGAYYTSIPSAQLLVKLALDPEAFSVDWSSLDAIQSVHVADLACGTGTLLMAAADVLSDNYVRASAKEQKQPDLSELQRRLVANTIYGYDVLSSAIHLTASTLALRVPETPINVTHLYKMPLGGKELLLGTLEFLDRTAPMATLFSERQRVGGSGVDTTGSILPKLDLCVMNPPFTRSVGCNLLFGNHPEAERRLMQKRLRKLVSSGDFEASITAGLGSVFVALADSRLKKGGSLALVLPRSLLSGVAWQKTRNLIEKDYRVSWIVVSHEPGKWNFSENTSLSETLVVARRGKKGGKTRCANLWRQPTTAVEALSLSTQLLEREPSSLANESGTTELFVGQSKIGEVTVVDWSDLSGELWSIPCSFAQTSLNRALWHLRQGRVVTPQRGAVGVVPLRPLGELGDLGFDRRDIHDGFEASGSVTSFPAVWGQSSQSHTSMGQRPNRWLRPLERPRSGRPLRRVRDLWARAGRVLIAERMRLNTMRLLAAYTAEPVLANVWWTLVLRDLGEDFEKAMVLWLNSTLGVMISLGHRSETEGPFVDFKKPVLTGMPVLDVSSLPRESVRILSEAFDANRDQDLAPLGLIAEDQVRTRLDSAVCEALGLPDIGALREALGREPILTLSLAGLLRGC